MSKTKRLRVFAGPNGSGKSTLFLDIQKKFPTGPFVNSDFVESLISNKGYVNLSDFGLQLSHEDLDRFFQQPSSISLLEKAQQTGHEINISIKDNVIVDKSKDTHSYEASLITSFIRFHLLQRGVSYSFESVMSHSSKLDEIALARERGYKSYLYFVCLDDPSLNVSRVLDRIKKGGHVVPEEKIIQRYGRVLDLLLEAINLCDTVFLFDNSSTKGMTLIAKKEKGELTILVDSDQFPNWFIRSVINRLGN